MESAPTTDGKVRGKWETCGGANTHGRAMALPYKTSERDRPNRTAATTRAAVGRDALIPPGSAAKQPPNFELQRKVRRAATFSGPPAFFLHPARAPRIGMGVYPKRRRAHACTAVGGSGGGGGPAAPIIVGGLGSGDAKNCGPTRLGGGILFVDGIIYASSPSNVVRTTPGDSP